jgi:sigma-E factor negative regulatory protein RseC
MQLAEQTAIVNHVDGDLAYLKANSNAGCGSCSSKLSCGSTSLFSFTPNNYLKVTNTLDLRAGDSVIVSIPSEKLLFGTVLVYLLPLFVLFGFAIVGKLLLGESASILLGLVGLFLSLIFVKKFIAQKNIRPQFEPVIQRKIIRVNAN